MNLFHSMKFVRSFQCTEWHAKSAVCETTVYTRIVSHSELNWECILNSSSSPECMSELVLSCRWLGIVSPGSEVSWEQQMRLWKLRAGRSDACCELSSSVCVCLCGCDWIKQRVFQLAFFICSISHVGPISESSPASSSSERSRDKAMENDNRLVCVCIHLQCRWSITQDALHAPIMIKSHFPWFPFKCFEKSHRLI